jgi:hypothetical protein
VRRIFAVVLVLSCALTQANAWGTRGHELVAYLAYIHLDPAVQKQVDALIQLNPCHQEWNKAVSTLPAAQQSAGLFMLAASWPDKIKLAAPVAKVPYDCQPGLVFSKADGAAGATGHFSADIAPDVPEAGRNIGYTDDRRHQYWHFIDMPYAADATPTQPAGKVNVLTQVQLLSAALATHEDASLASYDLVWLEHMTGDIHQPLHNTQRFSAAYPNGDAGANLVKICAGAAPCRDELHAYWDGLPGSDGALSAIMKQGDSFDPKQPPTVDQLDIDHPENWAAGAFEIAKADAYVAPFVPTAKVVDPSAIPASYHARAIADMQQQIVLAGYRLSAMLNRSLAN